MDESLTERFQNLGRAVFPECLSQSMARSDKSRRSAKPSPPREGPNAPGAAGQLQPPRPLAAAPAHKRNILQDAPSPFPYLHHPTTSVPFQQQGYNAQFPPTSGSMVNPQAWTAITMQATPAIAGPAPIQQSNNLEEMSLFMHWPGQGGPQASFHTQVHGGHVGPLPSGSYPVTRAASHGAYGVGSRPSQQFQPGTAARELRSTRYHEASRDGPDGH